jgi:tripartite-type tricarboxylate transporter receptor subunit TctC
MVEISNIRRLTFKTIAAVSVALIGSVTNANAQNYPNRAIKLIAPYPAGGGVDSVARLIGEKLSARLNQAIVIDNKPGAAGTIGADALAKSPADGYTLMLGSITDYSIAPHVHKSLGFDLRKDFAPIAELGYGTVVLVVNADFPARHVKELIGMAKAKPGDLSFASSGLGGLQHLNGEMFKQMAGVDLVHVPYKGSTQLLPDLLAGRVPMAFDSLPPHLPHIKSGKVRALAVASATRSSAIPDVPTMAEAGIPGYESATNYTLFAPAGISKDIASLLNKEVNLILKTPEVREKLTALGITITGGSIESVEKRIPAEIEKWNRVVKNGNLKFD